MSNEIVKSKDTMTAGLMAVLDFGSDKTATTTFTVQTPANTATSALIRFS